MSVYCKNCVHCKSSFASGPNASCNSDVFAQYRLTHVVTGQVTYPSCVSMRSYSMACEGYVKKSFIDHLTSVSGLFYVTVSFWIAFLVVVGYATITARQLLINQELS